MWFDQDNFNNITEKVMGNLENAQVHGNPKVNDVMYEIQQKFLPEYLFSSIPNFFIDFRTHKEGFFYMMITRLYELMHKESFPGFIEAFYCSIEIIDNNYELIQINWDTQQTLLAKRIYIISDLTYTNAAYFLTENTFGGSLMLCRVGLDKYDSLARANYGNVPDNENIEKEMILDLLQNR